LLSRKEVDLRDMLSAVWDTFVPEE
jgi:hypothetical protein